MGLKEEWVQLRSQDTKTKQPRKVYLTPQALDVLRTATQIRTLINKNVFLYEGRPISGFRTAFMTACRISGIKDFRFQDIRHCFITNMRRAGISRSVIMVMTGHRTENMFHRYNTIDEQDIRVALKREEKYFQRGNYSLCTPKAKRDPNRYYRRVSMSPI